MMFPWARAWSSPMAASTCEIFNDLLTQLDPLATAMPLCDLVEFIGGSPYVDGILAKPFALDAEGWLTIPDLPGLGVTIDRDKLGRYTPDPGALFV